MKATRELYEYVAKEVRKYLKNRTPGELRTATGLTTQAIAKLRAGKTKIVNTETLMALAEGLGRPRWYFMELLMFMDDPAHHADPRYVHVDANTKITSENLMGWWKSDDGSPYPKYTKVTSIASGSQQVKLGETWVPLQKLANNYVPTTEQEALAALLGSKD